LRTQPDRGKRSGGDAKDSLSMGFTPAGSWDTLIRHRKTDRRV
jgi:hypothetical protein